MLSGYPEKAKCPYLEAFITETQRLGNILPFSVPHLANRDFYLTSPKTKKDFFIPKDTQVFTSISSILMDPKTFPNPDIFDPTRFLENGSFVPVNQVLQCI